MSLAIILWYWW